MTPSDAAAAHVPHYTETPAPAVAGDTERLVTTVAGGLLALFGLSRRSLPGLAIAGIGGVLVARGVRGRLGAGPDPVEIDQAQSVLVPRKDAYAYWRALENLPRFMEHIRSVEQITATRSRWTAKGPGPLPDITWEADIVEDVPGERIVWQSLPGADVDNAGHVRFEDGPNGLTEVYARITYRPPAGYLGAAVAKWLDPVLATSVRRDIARFKSVLEAGEVPTNDPHVKGD